MRLLRDLVQRVGVWPVPGQVELLVGVDPHVVHDRDGRHEVESEPRELELRARECPAWEESGHFSLAITKRTLTGKCFLHFVWCFITTGADFIGLRRPGRAHFVREVILKPSVVPEVISPMLIECPVKRGKMGKNFSG